VGRPVDRRGARLVDERVELVALDETRVAVARPQHDEPGHPRRLEHRLAGRVVDDRLVLARGDLVAQRPDVLAGQPVEGVGQVVTPLGEVGDRLVALVALGARESVQRLLGVGQELAEPVGPPLGLGLEECQLVGAGGPRCLGRDERVEVDLVQFSLQIASVPEACDGGEPARQGRAPVWEAAIGTRRDNRLGQSTTYLPRNRASTPNNFSTS
jgi:hypothetical protein